MSTMTITFPGGVAVDAELRGLKVHTDQRPEHGGGGTGPEPFELFLASLGTCAGFYALRFCQQRGIDTTGLGLDLTTEKDPSGTRIGTVRLAIHLPAGFPDKYRDAIVRAADQCAVKRHVVEAPVFEVVACRARQPELVEV
ncbi:MAG TPA: OsmC family protein [Thermoanaerobaculia bacterium]|nr:OsmC family protein [Thermoanaerobaculia bacterium]